MTQSRKATIKDIKAIHHLVNQYANQGLLLPKSLNDLYGHMRDFFVAETDPPNNIIQGVCALGICWEDLAEIKSLAVQENEWRTGLGAHLVNACLEEADSIGIKKVFTLTYVTGFFKKIGFFEIKKAILPHKIWADCLQCPKFPDCDETAMMIEL
jgi:amino-acid N-acetyltransferase